MIAIKIKPGKAYDLYALERNGRRDLLEFLLDLRDSARVEFTRLMRSFDYTTDIGLIKTEQRFKRLTVDIYEFKTHGGVRVLCFLDGRSIVVLTNGFKKKKNYTDEITKAEHLRAEYLNARVNDCLTYMEETVL